LLEPSHQDRDLTVAQLNDKSTKN